MRIPDHIGGFRFGWREEFDKSFFDSDTVYIHKSQIGILKYEDPTWQTAEYFKEVTRKLTEAKVQWSNITSDDTSGLFLDRCNDDEEGRL